MSNNRSNLSKHDVWLDNETTRIYIKVPYNEDFKEDLKTDFAGRWDPEEKVWYVSNEDYSLAEVQKLVKLHFPEYRP